MSSVNAVQDLEMSGNKISPTLDYTNQAMKQQLMPCHLLQYFLSLQCFFVVYFFDRVTIFFISQNRQLAAKFVDMHFLFLVFSFHLYILFAREMKQEIAQSWSSWDSRGAWIFCLDVGLLLPHLFPTGTHKLQVI